MSIFDFLKSKNSSSRRGVSDESSNATKAANENTSFTICGKTYNIDKEKLAIDQQALEAYEAKNYPVALRYYSQLIEMDGTAHQYYQFRGTVYEDMGDDNSAKSDFEKAIQLEPKNNVALFRLGMLYQRRNDLSSAVRYLQKAYDCTPTYDDLMGNSYNNILFVHKRVVACNLGNFLTQLGRVEEGLKYIDEVISKCPDYSFPYFVKAITLSNKEENEQALKYAQKAAQLGHAKGNALIEYIKSKMASSQTQDCLHDKYASMVRNSGFNPFKISVEPSMQNPNHLPNYVDVFRRELSSSLSNPAIRQALGEEQIITSYIFNLVESYYNNAGYVPKNTIDEIIDQVYTALTRLNNTCFRDIDSLKYKVYFSFLNR
jgi:tetratricopeptide (TPR) repeat protein